MNMLTTCATKNTVRIKKRKKKKEIIRLRRRRRRQREMKVGESLERESVSNGNQPFLSAQNCMLTCLLLSTRLTASRMPRASFATQLHASMPSSSFIFLPYAPLSLLYTFCFDADFFFNYFGEVIFCTYR